MAIASIEDAYTQYNANLSWQNSRSSADLALQAIRYLVANRAKMTADQGSQIDFESLGGEKIKLEAFLGVGSPRAFGRKRTLNARFSSDTGVG